MTVFCTEASLLGVQSKLNSEIPLIDSEGTHNSTSSNEQILITPDLWLLDDQLNDLPKTKVEHHDDSAALFDSIDPAETEAPLNLSRCNMQTKRKSTNLKIALTA